MSGAIHVLLLRHGQSEWNALQRWQGTADSPLSELGRRQARFVGAVLAAGRHGFGDVWASDLARAHETAEVVAEALALRPVRIDSRLREAHAGEWEGLTAPEINDRWPGYLEAQRRPPGFESFASVVARVLPALRDLAAAATDGAPQLAVAHSGVIRTVVRHLGYADARVANLGGVWLTIDRGHEPAAPSDAAGIALTGQFDPVANPAAGEVGEWPGVAPSEAPTPR